MICNVHHFATVSLALTSAVGISVITHWLGTLNCAK